MNLKNNNSSFVSEDIDKDDSFDSETSLRRVEQVDNMMGP